MGPLKGSVVEVDLRHQSISKMPIPLVVGPNMNIHEDQHRRHRR